MENLEISLENQTIGECRQTRNVGLDNQTIPENCLEWGISNGSNTVISTVYSTGVETKLGKSINFSVNSIPGPKISVKKVESARQKMLENLGLFSCP